MKRPEELTDEECDLLYDRYDDDWENDEDVIQPNNEEAGFGYLNF